MTYIICSKCDRTCTSGTATKKRIVCGSCLKKEQDKEKDMNEFKPTHVYVGSHHENRIGTLCVVLRRKGFDDTYYIAFRDGYETAVFLKNLSVIPKYAARRLADLEALAARVAKVGLTISEGHEYAPCCSTVSHGHFSDCIFSQAKRLVNPESKKHKYRIKVKVPTVEAYECMAADKHEALAHIKDVFSDVVIGIDDSDFEVIKID